MQRFLLRLGQVLMLLVLFAAGGGHWMALQSFAWTRMVLSYSHQGPLVEAVTKTFSGRHPCDLCKQVERSRESEPAPQDAQQENQASFVAPLMVVVVNSSRVSWEVEIPQMISSGREEPPATPPPRLAAA